MNDPLGTDSFLAALRGSYAERHAESDPHHDADTERYEREVHAPTEGGESGERPE